VSEECFGNQILKVPLFDEDDPRNENRKTVNKLSKHIDYSTLFFCNNNCTSPGTCGTGDKLRMCLALEKYQHKKCRINGPIRYNHTDCRCFKDFLYCGNLVGSYH